MFQLTKKHIRMMIGMGMFISFMHIIGIINPIVSLFEFTGFYSLVLLYFTQSAIFYIILSYYVLTKLIPYEVSK